MALWRNRRLHKSRHDLRVSALLSTGHDWLCGIIRSPPVTVRRVNSIELAAVAALISISGHFLHGMIPDVRRPPGIRHGSETCHLSVPVSKKLVSRPVVAVQPPISAEGSQGYAVIRIHRTRDDLRAPCCLIAIASGNAFAAATLPGVVGQIFRLVEKCSTHARLPRGRVSH